MAVITLTTDWQNDDYYISMMKGRIIRAFSEAHMIDISHQVQSFGLAQAVFIVKASYLNYPEGSVHIIAVNCEAGNDRPYIAAKIKNHYFISADNGFIGLLTEEDPEIIVELVEKEISSFPEANLFADAAALLASGVAIETLGSVTKMFNRQIHLLPVFDQNTINGNVIYVDSYKNIITNISRSLFDRIAKDRAFDILVQSNREKINQISKRYNEVPSGELLALFNSLDLLEIAINKGNVSELLNLGTNASIRIKFYEKGIKPEDDYLKNFK